MLIVIAIEQYLNSCRARGLAAGTVNLYRSDLDSLFAFVRRDSALTDVDEQAVTRWLAWLWKRPNRVRAGKLSAATVQRYYRCAHSFFEWCAARGLLDANPLARVERPRIPRAERRVLSVAEMSALLDALGATKNPVRDTALGYVFLDCGLRLAEACNLRPDDLDFERGLITVRIGKGGRGRRVPMTPPTMAVLRVWLIVRPASPGASLFCASPGAVYQLFRRMSRLTGLPCNPHNLRHSMATHWDGGLDDLAAILGHADPATTARLYRHRDIDQIRAEHLRRSAVMRLRNVR